MCTMIQATELRLGNLFQDKLTGSLLRVDELNAEGKVSFYVIDRTKYPLPDGWEAKPIPITPEILRKTALITLPFKQSEQRLFCAPEHIREKSAKDEGIKYCSFFFNERLGKWMDTQSRVCVIYLHQLQNLYFALTGEELQINATNS